MAEAQDPGGSESSSFDKMREFGLEEAKQRQSEQPVWQKDPLPIKMMAESPEEKAAREAMEANLSLEYRADYTSPKSLVNDLEGAIDWLQGKRIPEKRGRKEEVGTPEEMIAKAYENIVNEGIDHIADMQSYLFSLHNPYPYDSRWGQQWFQGVEKELRRIERRRDLKEEARAWINRTRADVDWMRATYYLEDAMGPSTIFYYDGELQMKLLRTQHIKPTDEDFERKFALKPDGIGVSEQEQKFIEKTIIDAGATRQERLKKFLKEEAHPLGIKEISDVEIAKEGMREVAIKYQDDNVFWRMAVANVQQIDYLKPRDQWMAMDLTDTEIKLIYDLFKDGNNIDFGGQNFPERVLNLYNMPMSGEKVRKYMATMEALLISGAKDRLLEMEGKADFATTYQQLLTEISTYVEKRSGMWYGDQGSVMKDRIARIITKDGTLLDWGLMASGDLGWGWEYVVEEGQLVRKSELGSIYGAFDVPTVMYWMRHMVDYDKNSETRTPLLPPTPDEWRREYLKHEPDWKPRLEDETAKDPVLRDSIEMIWGPSQESFRTSVEVRKGAVFGNLDPKVVEYMKKNVSVIVTPFRDTDEGLKHNLAFPVFIPPKLDFLNFWTNLSLEGDNPDVKKPGSSSIWEVLLRRKKPLSDMGWKRMQQHAVDWWHVNLDQSVRWVGLLVNDYKSSKEAEEQFNFFFEKAGTHALKTLSKRVRLGTRGDPAPKGVLETAYLPTMLSMALAAKHGLYADQAAIEAKIVSWQADVVKWINAFMNLPPKKYDVSNFNKGMALIFFSQSIILRRISQAATDLQKDSDYDVGRFVEKEFSDRLGRKKTKTKQ